MIPYILAFLIILGVSFYLAYLSMKDFYDFPPKDASYGLFLIRNPSALTNKLLDEIRRYLRPAGLIVSFERLFKGPKSALVVFGPKKMLESFGSLNLLELEDYTRLTKVSISAWELKKPLYVLDGKLQENEQLWLQFCLQGSGDFRVAMRAVLLTSKPTKFKKDSLEIFRAYQKRLIQPFGEDTVHLSSAKLLEAILQPLDNPGGHRQQTP